jgi:hypothetical protein
VQEIIRRQGRSAIRFINLIGRVSCAGVKFRNRKTSLKAALKYMPFQKQVNPPAIRLD